MLDAVPCQGETGQLQPVFPVRSSYRQTQHRRQIAYGLQDFELTSGVLCFVWFASVLPDNAE